jgi:hypothetical protein
MKFKEYEKRYENFFLREDALRLCDLSLITNDKGWPTEDYFLMVRTYIKDLMSRLFLEAVRFFWMQKRFFYNGMQKKKLSKNHYRVDNAFAMFMRHYSKVNYRVFTSSFYYGKVVSYFDDFFPEFDTYNPFEEPERYAFPYKNITLDFLTVVYQMPERLELLKIADEKKMSYAMFLDYIINHISCLEEERPGRYEFVFARLCPPYVRYNLSERNAKRIAREKKKALNELNELK